MVKKNPPETIPCCGPGEKLNCCNVESILTIDGKGQIVLPKDVRDKMGFGAGEKIALIVLETEGKPCCVTLIKASQLSAGVKDFLGPILK